MFYINITNRCARLQGPVLGTTSAYALNFVKKDIIDPYERGERKDIIYVRFDSSANPSYPKDEYERLKQILPQRIFRMRLQGFHDKAEGLIFEDWDTGNWCDSIPLREAQVYGGIDWGFDHPMALVVRAVVGRSAYGVSLFKRSGLSVMQQLDLIAAKTKTFGVKLWFCGHDRPEMISELNKRGIPAITYFQTNPEYKEVNSGNALHAQIIKTKQYKVFRHIDQWHDLQDEYETYVWDKKEEEYSSKERPRDENNDLISAERYCTIGTIHLMKEKIEEPKLPLSFLHRIDKFDPRKSVKRSYDEW